MAVGALALLEKVILQLLNMIIFQKYTESFYLEATVNSLFQGFIMLSMKSYIVNGKHYNSNKSLTKSSFVNAFWPTSLQLGEVQHFIKHQCQVRYTPFDCWKAMTFNLAYTKWNDKVQNEISNKYIQESISYIP